MKFKQIVVNDKFVYGLDDAGRVWVAIIGGDGQSNTEWKLFERDLNN